MPTRKEQENQNSKVMEKLILGGFSGIVAKTVVSPIERIRILQQTGTVYGKSGFLSISKEVFREEG